jgi:hypothetical protein
LTQRANEQLGDTLATASLTLSLAESERVDESSMLSLIYHYWHQAIFA